MPMTIQAGLKFLADGKGLVDSGDLKLADYHNAFKAKYGRPTTLSDDDLICIIMADEEGDGAGDVSWYLPHIKQAESVSVPRGNTLSVAQIITRLQDDTAIVPALEKIFQANLTEKQGPLVLFRRLCKDFTADELAGMPTPGSKPPGQNEGEKDADYRKRLASSNAVYDYVPESTRNGDKVPAYYRWKEIADGLNPDNILEHERIGKFLSSRTEQSERNAIPGALVYRQKSRAQLENMQETARKRRDSFRTNLARAFNFLKQLNRIDNEYPAVNVKLATVDGAEPDADGNLPLETSAAPVLVFKSDNPMIGTALTVNSFIRLNIDKALTSPVQPGTYDALLDSANKDEPEDDAGDGLGDGKATASRDELNHFFSKLAHTVEVKAGNDLLTVMLAEKDNDAFLLSVGKFYYALEAHMKGTVAKKYNRLLQEEQDREEADKTKRRAEMEASVAEYEAAKGLQRQSAGNTAEVS